MKRRHLFGAAAALLATLGLAGCNDDKKVETTGQQAASEPAKTYTWKMVTAWPKNYPGLGTAAERLAERVKVMSDGRLTIKVYAAGELVPALEVFDAVSAAPPNWAMALPITGRARCPPRNSSPPCRSACRPSR